MWLQALQGGEGQVEGLTHGVAEDQSRVHVHERMLILETVLCLVWTCHGWLNGTTIPWRACGAARRSEWPERISTLYVWLGLSWIPESMTMKSTLLLMYVRCNVSTTTHFGACMCSRHLVHLSLICCCAYSIEVFLSSYCCSVAPALVSSGLVCPGLSRCEYM